MELPLMIQLLVSIMYGITESEGILIEGSSDSASTEHLYEKCREVFMTWTESTNALKEVCHEVYVAKNRKKMERSRYLDEKINASVCHHAKNLGIRRIEFRHVASRHMVTYLLECTCSSDIKGKSKSTEASTSTDPPFCLMKTENGYFEFEEAAEYDEESVMYDEKNRKMYYLSKFWQKQRGV